MNTITVSTAAEQIAGVASEIKTEAINSPVKKATTVIERMQELSKQRQLIWYEAKEDISNIDNFDPLVCFNTNEFKQTLQCYRSLKVPLPLFVSPSKDQEGRFVVRVFPDSLAVRKAAGETAGKPVIIENLSRSEELWILFSYNPSSIKAVANNVSLGEMTFLLLKHFEANPEDDWGWNFSGGDKYKKVQQILGFKSEETAKRYYNIYDYNKDWLREVDEGKRNFNDTYDLVRRLRNNNISFEEYVEHQPEIEQAEQQSIAEHRFNFSIGVNEQGTPVLFDETGTVVAETKGKMKGVNSILFHFVWESFTIDVQKKLPKPVKPDEPKGDKIIMKPETIPGYYVVLDSKAGDVTLRTYAHQTIKGGKSGIKWLEDHREATMFDTRDDAETVVAFLGEGKVVTGNKLIP
jgi:hypothetical protein